MQDKNIRELSEGLKSKAFSSLELTESFLKRIERLDPSINAFITVTPEKALEAAKAADLALSKGTAGPLTGIPIAQKDIFCTEGVRSSCGSKMLDQFISPYNATVVDRLNAAGTVMLGKLNMDEFAMGSSNETSFYGPVKNPWNLETVPAAHRVARRRPSPPVSCLALPAPIPAARSDSPPPFAASPASSRPMASCPAGA